MTMKRRVWRRPELTILVRNKPEESVLAACKVDGHPQYGVPSVDHSSSCKHHIGTCDICSAHNGS